MRDPARTRETLLETAVELVQRKSYDSVGVNEICSHAGVTKGAFYHHFESKADLYCAAAEHHWAAIKKELDALCSPTYTPLQQLENLIAFIAGRQEAVSIACGNGASATKSAEGADCPFITLGVRDDAADERLLRSMSEMAENGVRYCSALVRGLKAEDALNSDSDTEQLGRLMFQFMKGLFYYTQITRNPAAIAADLREGFYRLLDLKPEHRKPPQD
jgi:TetR/AcrR family transcriptional repressor of nem operon